MEAVIQVNKECMTITCDKPIPITRTYNGEERHYILIFTKAGNLLLNLDKTIDNNKKLS